MVSEPSLGSGARWRSLPPFVRFAVVGGVNTMFSYGAYAFFLAIGIHYAGAALLSTVAGVVFNFFTTGRFVFDGRHRLHRALPFLLVYGAVYALNVVALAGLHRLGVDPYVSGLVLILPLAALTFVLLRRFVFGAVDVAH